MSEKVFVIKKVKNSLPWTYVISDLNGQEIVGTFYKKKLQKTNQKNFEVERVISELDVDKLALVPVDLKERSGVVDNNVVKKGAYNELVKKVNAIGTTKSKILKIKYLVLLT